jgi:formylglycine-generating enzyme required for sulfatase activity
MKRIILFLTFMVLGHLGFSNNIQLSNLSTTFTASTGVVTVNFNLSWDNSWRSNATSNYDAAWVFFKFKDNGIWYHLDLTGNDITLPSGYEATVAFDKKGVFIHRDNSNIGTGNVSLTACSFGVVPQMGTYDVKAFAIEMVYVPGGAFYVGDGASNGAYKAGGLGGPYFVMDNNITKGDQFVTQLNTPDNFTPIGAKFPTGFKPFFLMKYELSVGGFRDFLNCLTYNQQLNLMGTSISNTGVYFGNPSYNPGLWISTAASSGQPAVFVCNSNGNGVFNESNDGEWGAFNWVTPAMYLAYLDWSALRPMSDLEYEKSCRGPLLPIPGEFAWGNPNLTGTMFLGLQNQFEANEIRGASSTINCNLDLDTLSSYGFGRQTRPGMFATSSSSRSTAGAGYYGAMDLTGNLYEFVVSCHHTSSAGYNGLHGDGNLGISGHNQTWPFINANLVVNFIPIPYTTGLEKRGGSFYWENSLFGGNSGFQDFGRVSFRGSSFTNMIQPWGPVLNSNTVANGIRGARSVLEP